MILQFPSFLCALDENLEGFYVILLKALTTKSFKEVDN